MDDLISRQAAIDALKVRVTIGRANGKSVALKIANDYADIVKKRIEALPSAQPKLEQNTHLEQRENDKLGVKMGETCTDTISRQAAIDAVEIEIDNIDHIPRWFTERLTGVLEQLPSAQRKNGKWIHDGYDFPGGNDWIHCSECGKRGINVPADLTNYCPNCGADMRGEGNGNE